MHAPWIAATHRHPQRRQCIERILPQLAGPGGVDLPPEVEELLDVGADDERIVLPAPDHARAHVRVGVHLGEHPGQLLAQRPRELVHGLAGHVEGQHQHVVLSRRGEWQASAGPRSLALDDHSVAEPTGRAHRHQAELSAPPRQLVGQRGEDAPAGGAERMPDRDRPAHDVQPRAIHLAHGLRCTRPARPRRATRTPAGCTAPAPRTPRASPRGPCRASGEPGALQRHRRREHRRLSSCSPGSSAA